MATLARRRATVTVAVPLGRELNRFGADVVEIADLRVTFKVKKTLAKEPNTAEVVIYNLSEQTRSALQGPARRVVLSAGYEETLAAIFVGDARDCDSVPEGPTWQTTLQLGDGERAYRHGRVNESFRAGVSVASVLQKIADEMGLDGSRIGGVPELRGRQYVSGYAARGRSSRELDRILKGFGLEWSIQDGQLQVLAPQAATAEVVVELTPETGLVGSPTLNTPEGAGRYVSAFTGEVTSTGTGKPTLRATSLLQPEIRPGRRVRVDSEETGISGLFRVTSVEHVGDTHGGEWYSRIEAVPV